MPITPSSGARATSGAVIVRSASSPSGRASGSFGVRTPLAYVARIVTVMARPSENGGRRPRSTRLAQVGQLLADRGVVARLHAERRRPARRVPQVARVAEHRRQRDV